MYNDSKTPLAIALTEAGIALRILRTPGREPTEAKQSDGKPWKHFAWRVALCGAGGKPRPQSEPIPYKCGVAHCVQPTAAQAKSMRERGTYGFSGGNVGKPIAPSAASVVYSLIMDGSACEESFDDWCANYGYDTDSKKATETYMACQRNGTLIRRFLGKDYDAIVEAAQDY